MSTDEFLRTVIAPPKGLGWPAVVALPFCSVSPVSCTATALAGTLKIWYRPPPSSTQRGAVPLNWAHATDVGTSELPSDSEFAVLVMFSTL